MFSALRVGVTAIAVMFALALLLAAFEKIPAAAMLAVARSMAPDCERPSADDVPKNVGALLSASARQSAPAGMLVADDPGRWAVAAAAKIESLGESSRDLVEVGLLDFAAAQVRAAAPR